MGGAFLIIAVYCSYWLKVCRRCLSLSVLSAPHTDSLQIACHDRLPFTCSSPRNAWALANLARDHYSTEDSAHPIHFSLLPEWTDLEGLVWIARAMSSRSLAHKGLLELWMDQTDLISPALNAQSNVMLEHICFVLQPLRDCLSARSCPRAIRSALQNAIPPASYQRMVFYAVNLDAEVYGRRVSFEEVSVFLQITEQLKLLWLSLPELAPALWRILVAFHAYLP